MKNAIYLAVGVVAYLLTGSLVALILMMTIVITPMGMRWLKEWAKESGNAEVQRVVDVLTREE